MTRTNAAITARDVVKRYGGTGRGKGAPVTAVDDVGIDVATGEFFGILGPNGAGKTTLLEILEGLRTRRRNRAGAR